MADSFVWGDQTWFYGELDAFKSYLGAHGVAYSTWAANHPDAAAILTTPPEKPEPAIGSVPASSGPPSAEAAPPPPPPPAPAPDATKPEPAIGSVPASSGPPSAETLATPPPVIAPPVAAVTPPPAPAAPVESAPPPDRTLQAITVTVPFVPSQPAGVSAAWDALVDALLAAPTTVATALEAQADRIQSLFH